jgi:hypothetical protein
VVVFVVAFVGGTAGVGVPPVKSPLATSGGALGDGVATRS